MYEQIFNFSSRPFTSAPFVKHYFPGDSIHQALAQSRQSIDRAAGPVVIVGAAGTGKSLALAMLEEQYRSQFNVANLGCVRLDRRQDLLQSLLFTLNQPHQGMTEGDLRFALIDFLKPGDKCPNGVLLLVDEAHSLPVELLDEIRLITNFVRDGEARVRLVLAGNQRLEENLTNAKLQSLNQRISARCFLSSMSRDETKRYVVDHIDRVGGQGEKLFESSGFKTIHEVSDGCPRLVNQVSEHALIIAAANGLETIGEDCVREAWADVQGIPGNWSSPDRIVTDKTQLQGDENWTVIEFGELDGEAEGGNLTDQPTLAVGGEPSVQTHFVDEPVESEEAEMGLNVEAADIAFGELSDDTEDQNQMNSTDNTLNPYNSEESVELTPGFETSETELTTECSAESNPEFETVDFESNPSGDLRSGTGFYPQAEDSIGLFESSDSSSNQVVETDEWQAEEDSREVEPAPESSVEFALAASGSLEQESESESRAGAEGAGCGSEECDGPQATLETVDPFDETFADEERLIDRFAPVVAHQNQTSLKVTSEDLESIRPQAEFTEEDLLQAFSGEVQANHELISEKTNDNAFGNAAEESVEKEPAEGSEPSVSFDQEAALPIVSVSDFAKENQDASEVEIEPTNGAAKETAGEDLYRASNIVEQALGLTGQTDGEASAIFPTVEIIESISESPFAAVSEKELEDTNGMPKVGLPDPRADFFMPVDCVPLVGSIFPVDDADRSDSQVASGDASEGEKSEAETRSEDNHSEEIQRRAAEILERLKMSQDVSHETDTQEIANTADTELDVAKHSPPMFGGISPPEPAMPLHESERVLQEILEQKRILAAKRNPNEFGMSSPVEAVGDLPKTELGERNQLGNEPRDDREMIIVSRMEQREEGEAKPEPEPTPTDEEPVSTGRAERMDYQKLFDQLRNITGEGSA